MFEPIFEKRHVRYLNCVFKTGTNHIVGGHKNLVTLDTISCLSCCLLVVPLVPLVPLMCKVVRR